MNKSHEQVQTLLPFYVANQLSDDEVYAVERHLLDCSDCAISIHNWQQIATVVRNRAHRASSLPMLQIPRHTPQPSLSTRLRLMLTGAAVLVIGIALIFVMQSIMPIPSSQYAIQNATPTLAPTVVPKAVQLPASFHATDYAWEPQGWNNQGPASLLQVLRHFGWHGTQNDIASALKPNRLDKQVTIPEMIDFVHNHTDLAATSRIIGTTDLLKRLLAANFGVIVAVGLEIEDIGWFGHYLTLIGYEERTQKLFFLDTYLGDGGDRRGIIYSYTEFDQWWMQFNRAYMVVYPKERETELMTLLGTDSDPDVNYFRAAKIVERDMKLYPDSIFVQLNMCEANLHRNSGNRIKPLFRSPMNCFITQPHDKLFYRILLYRYVLLEAYYESGMYNELIMLTNRALLLTTDVEELYYWRGMARAARQQITLAIEDFKSALKANPNFARAKEMLEQLDGDVQEF